LIRACSPVLFWHTPALFAASLHVLAVPGRYRFYEGIFMAVQYFDSSLDLTDFTADHDETASDTRPEEEINLGAFRGLAFALILETALVTLGGVVFQLLRMLF
jgi:hypothetical protein